MACKDCIHAKDPMSGFPNQVFCDYIYLHISALPYYDKSERCDGYKPKATNADVVERKHGHRGHWEAYDFHTVECSACEFRIDIMKIYGHVLTHLNFCPNCGADMRGDPDG